MSSFRKHLFPLDHPRLEGLAALGPCSYGDAMRSHPVAGPLIKDWLDLFRSGVFRGITTDGEIVPALFPAGADEGAPAAAAAGAAARLLSGLSAEQADRVTHPVGSAVWRAWMNPEFYVNRYGLRLEDLAQGVRDLVFELMAASLSEAGFRKARDLMRINGFLGELVELPRVMNEFSYNINIFGTPSLTQPWGWQLYGHHLCLNTLFVGGQQVFTPVFMGAEPNEIDTGPHAGTTVFTVQENLGLQLIRALPPDQARTATLYRHKRDPAMPEGRRHPGDELHLGGAFQDNRIIPTEGLCLRGAAPQHREQAVAIIEEFLSYQPDGPRAARIAAVRQHLDDTWFCWIGGTGDDDAFYYRIQSPVLIVEFDHHAGIFLANPEPERFHIHTLVRTPNGNDYGAALVAAATGQPQLLDGPA